MIEDLAAYNHEYQKQNIVRKIVKFNKKNPEDLQLLSWIELQDNFSGYCRRLIRADMEEKTEKPRE